jgi:release factor glutamine methyltransferase
VTEVVIGTAETRGAALQLMSATFTEAGLETPELDARLLLAHVLGVAQLQLLTERDTLLPAAAKTPLASVMARRLAREPVSRIIGERWFYGRAFLVTPATLDPRPDSETLIDAACALMRKAGIANDDMRILDVGTGTGCLLLTLLSELPGARGVGTDASAAALAVAAENQTRLMTKPAATAHERDALRHVAWRHGSGFAPVNGSIFNLIVSNPPYIPSAAIADLDQDVRHFDPKLALDGGVDGLDIYRQLAGQISTYLPDGWVVFEVGVGQAETVADLLRSAFAPRSVDLRVFKDLAGVQRCVAASPRPAGWSEQACEIALGR